MDPFDKHLDEPVQTDNRPRPEDGQEPGEELQTAGPRGDLEPEE